VGVRHLRHNANSVRHKTRASREFQRVREGGKRKDFSPLKISVFLKLKVVSTLKVLYLT
jgi:hypothetical protein